MRTAVLSFVLFAAATSLQADTLTYTVTPSGGNYQYEFSIANTGATGGPLFDLFLALPTDIGNIDTAGIGTPTGWGDASGGLLFFGPDAGPSTAFIQWSAHFSGSFDVPVGGSLAGYSFLALGRVASPLRFAVNGSVDLADTVEAPSAIPEPAAIALVGIGFAVFAGRKLLRVCLRRA